MSSVVLIVRVLKPVRRRSMSGSGIAFGESWLSMNVSMPISRTLATSPGRGPYPSRFSKWTIAASSEEGRRSAGFPPHGQKRRLGPGGGTGSEQGR